MDYLEKYEAELERRREAIASTAAVCSAPLADGHSMRSDIRPADYPVTIIGCIRGVDGWYLAGFDQRKRTIIPMQMIQRRSIFSGDDCRMCANSNRKTNSCISLPIEGGTPCRYYSPRPEQENHER